MTSVLFVVSEHGYWGEECIEPLETLSEAGLEITVATPTGSPPAVDGDLLTARGPGSSRVAAETLLAELDLAA